MFQLNKYMDMDSSLIDYLGRVYFIVWTVRSNYTISPLLKLRHKNNR